MDALIDPKAFTTEDVEMLLEQKYHIERCLLEKSTALLDLSNAYIHLKKRNAELESQQSKLREVNDVAKGVQDLKLDNSNETKTNMDAKSEVNFYKEKYKIIECNNAELRRKLSVCEKERDELLAFKKSHKEHADVEECKKRFQELERKYLQLKTESRASNLENRCLKVDGFLPQMKDSYSGSPQSPTLKPQQNDNSPDWNTSRLRPDNSFLQVPAVNRHITSRGACVNETRRME